MNIRVILAAAFAVGAMTVSAQSKEAPKATVSPAKKVEQETSKSRKEKKSVSTVDIGDPIARSMMTASERAAAKQKQSKKTAQEKKATDADKAAKVDRTVTSSVKGSAGKKAAQIATGGKYGSIIARYAAEYGVAVSLAHAVIRIESNYRADARGRAGEVGLMQIKPATARMIGYSGSTKGLYAPEINIKYGMKYLGMAQELGDGSTCGTILKYNAGHAAKRMNPISAAYCAKVKKHLAGA